MKNIKLEGTVPLYEKGDYVCTPEGYGIVTKDQDSKPGLDYFHTNVFVQHASGISRNPENVERMLSVTMLISITKEEYDKGVLSER